MQPYNVKPHKTRIYGTQSTLYVSDTYDLETGQGPKTWYESVDTKQVYGHTKFERFRLNGV